MRRCLGASLVALQMNVLPLSRRNASSVEEGEEEVAEGRRRRKRFSSTWSPPNGARLPPAHHS